MRLRLGDIRLIVVTDPGTLKLLFGREGHEGVSVEYGAVRNVRVFRLTMKPEATGREVALAYYVVIPNAMGLVPITVYHDAAQVIDGRTEDVSDTTGDAGPIRIRLGAEAIDVEPPVVLRPIGTTRLHFDYPITFDGNALRWVIEHIILPRIRASG